MSKTSTSSIDPFFEHNLSVKLVLEAGGQKVEILSGNLEKISLDLHTYGFSCNLQLSGFDNDDLNTLMNLTHIIKASLTFNSSDPLDPRSLLELKGIVTRKCFKRIDGIEIGKNEPIRLYEILILDAAHAIWSEHFPIGIYVDESMKDVFEKQKNADISLKYDFAALEKKNPIIAFSLPYNHWVPENEQVSFYSFVHWYLLQEGGIWAYDYLGHSYSILATKEEKEPFKINEWCVAPPICTLPKAIRYNAKIIKHTADALDSEDEENEDAYKSVRRESLSSTHYRTFPEHAYEDVVSLAPKDAEAEVEVVQFKEKLHLDKLLPGSYITFEGSSTPSWSQDSFYKGKIFRARSLFFEASKLEGSEKVEKPIQPYRLYVKILLELKEEVYVERPYFRPPVFPFSMQGAIFSDVGDKAQSTYKISEAEDAPQGQYLVTVPLAGKDKKVVVPFTPDFMSGQFYFPFCKGEKVLMSFYFRTAKIERILDWQPLARLPTQGNQIVLSSKGKDEYAIVKHEFEEGTNSIVTIKQSTSSTQTQTIQIKDKDIFIRVDEKDKKTLLFRLNTEEGLFLSLLDQTSKMTQEIAFNGQEMTLTCKNDSDTSTFVQKPDSITLTCKEFTVNSDKILLDATESITQSAATKYTVESKIANLKAKVKMGA